MVAPIDELKTVWDALRQSGQSEGSRAFPLREVADFRLQGEILYPDKLEALTIDFGQSLSKSLMSSGTGFALYCRDNDQVVLQRTSEGDLDIFIKIVEDILTQLYLWSKNNLSSQAVYLKFISRMQMWQNFMSKTNAGLTHEQEIGLLGELHFLRLWLSSNGEPIVVLESWRGPERAAQDFQFNERAVEIKSTTSKDKFDVKIQSLEQLDHNLFECLELVAIRFTKSMDEQGESLIDIIENIEDSLSGFAVSIFRSKLLSSGYEAYQREKYREKYCLNTASSYLVDESFPALNRTNTDAAIKNVRYNIELGDLTPCRNSIDEIVDIFEDEP